MRLAIEASQEEHMQRAIQASLQQDKPKGGSSDSGKRKTTEITDEDIMDQLWETENSELQEKYQLIVTELATQQQICEEIRQTPRLMDILFPKRAKRLKSSVEVGLLLL